MNYEVKERYNRVVIEMPGKVMGGTGCRKLSG